MPPQMNRNGYFTVMQTLLSHIRDTPGFDGLGNEITKGTIQCLKDLNVGNVGEIPSLDRQAANAYLTEQNIKPLVTA
jgi:hypothetical protein